jgi:nucleoside-diphosphate-sugar epimerase
VKILVTGANGFVGSNLVQHLVDAGHHVRAMMQPGTPAAGVDHVAHEVAWADLRSAEALRAAVRGVEGVAHLAAILGDFGPSEPYLQVNAEGTERLLDLAALAGARRFVLMSSLAVHRYRGHPDGDEETPADNETMPYAVSKRRAEEILRRAHDAGRIETVAVRPGLFLYGPNDRRHFVPLARSIERGFLPLVDGGRARLCSAYVDNLAVGVRLCLESAAAAGRTYVIGDGTPLTWRELFDRIADELGVRRPRLDLPARLVLPLARALERIVPRLGAYRDPGLTEYRVRLVSSDIVFRIDRARRELGYEPVVTVEEGLRRTVAWYRTSRAGRP